MNHSISKCLPACICLLLLFNYSLAQQKISGTVVSEENLPLGGATVKLKNSAVSTITGSEGSFTLVAKKGDVLEISFMGHKTREIKVENETTLKVALPLAMTSLDEVVVTGYTSQKIKEITGSVTVVKPKDLVAVPAGTAEQMLQGRVAGLSVVTTGEPGAAVDVRLHGVGNFGDVRPLYIIDGIEGNINALNPYDIESLQVLKDAGAYSIYGVRGANGVIVITTKKGKPGKTKLNYDAYVGVTQPVYRDFKLLSPQENADLLWMAFKNSGYVDGNGNSYHPLYGYGPTPRLPDYIFAGNNIGLFNGDTLADEARYNIDPSAGDIYQIVPFNKQGTDWFHELYNPAWSQSHTLTISGANEKNSYLASIGYLDQQGTYINTYLKRYTTRINTEFNILDNFRMGENLQFSYSQNPRVNNGTADFLFTDPYIPVYDIKGNWGGKEPPNIPNPTSNPVATRELSKDDKNHEWQVFGNIYAELDFLKKFTLKTNFGGTFTDYYGYNYLYGSYEPPPAGYYSQFYERSGYNSGWIWTNTLNFSTSIADYHKLKVLAGTEQRNNYFREQGGKRLGYFTDDPDYRFLSSGNPNGQENYSFAGSSFLSSFFGQLNYDYKEKYFFSGTLRRDGSSIFGPESRFGWFPSIGVAWRLTEEGFMSKLDWITDLKLRGSWGKTGFYGNTDPFNQYTLWAGGPGSSYYDLNGTSNTVLQGIRMVRIGNPNTSWQEDVVTNLGIESIFWNGKLSVTADWYDKRSNGLLFQLSLPDVIGDATRPNVNVGNIRNRGVDIALGSRGRISKDWNWDLLLTFSHYKNRVVKLNDIPFFDDWSFIVGPVVRNEVGYPAGSYFGYKISGIFSDDDDVTKSPTQEAAAPGRFKYADVNGRDTAGLLTGKPDGQITPDDRIHFGNPHPDFTLGTNFNLKYKQFDFSVFFYGSFGNDVFNYQKILNEIANAGGAAKSEAALYNSWTPDRKNTNVPIAEFIPNFSSAGVVNTYGLEDGTYFRCKSLILGYTVSRQSLQKFRIEKCRFYMQAANLFTITKYTGLDPELPGLYGERAGMPGVLPAFGIDIGNYPAGERKWLFGINLSF